MRKFLLVLLIPLFLIACGSDSQVDEPVPGMSKFKGLENEPSLSVVKNLEHGSLVQVNTVIEGISLEFGEVQYYFEPYDNELVIFMVDQFPGTIALEVEHIAEGSGEPLSGFDSSHIKIFDVLAGGRYLITISRGSSLGAFNFKIVQANRASLSLLKDDYVFRENITDYQKCKGETNIFERELYSRIDLGRKFRTQIPIGAEGVHYATNTFDARIFDTFYEQPGYWIETDGERGTLIGGGDYVIQVFDEDNRHLQDEFCDGYIETVGIVVL